MGVYLRENESYGRGKTGADDREWVMMKVEIMGEVGR